MIHEAILVDPVRGEDLAIICLYSKICFNIFYPRVDFKMLASTPLPRVDMLFRMLRLSHANIVDCGRLVGALSRADLVAIASSSPAAAGGAGAGEKAIPMSLMTAAAALSENQQ